MTPSAADFGRALQRERLEETLRALVASPSENPPGDEAAVAALVGDRCRSLGLEVTVHEAQPGRPNVVARRRFGSGPTLGYCSHYDVVPAGDHGLWAHPPYAAVVQDGHMHGRGTSDAKGPIAAALEAVALLDEVAPDLTGALELALVADEETMGFQGAGYLVSQGHFRPDLAIVGEPTSLRVVRAQRGACWFRLTTKGVAGHGSAPERGVNAIKHMAEIVLQLESALPDVTHPLLGGPSVNVGTVAGGTKTNIIPAWCTIEVDRRSVTAESIDDVRASVDLAIDRARQRFPEIDCTVELDFYSAPYETPEDAPIVRASVAAVSEALGRQGEIIGFRGASDARFISETGSDVVVWGPGDIAVAHTAREFIDLDELARGAVAYALAFARILSAS